MESGEQNDETNWGMGCVAWGGLAAGERVLPHCAVTTFTVPQW